MLQTVGLEEVGRERARHRAVEPEHYRVKGLLAPELRALLPDEHGLITSHHVTNWGRCPSDTKTEKKAKPGCR